MSIGIMPATVLIPIITGALIPIIPWKSRKTMMLFIEVLVIINSVLAVLAVAFNTHDTFIIAVFTEKISLGFKIDGIGNVFTLIIALLWPISTLYAFEYMSHERHTKIFFMFFTMTFGVTLGIAMAKDLVTMYCFYEALTLVTVPLVMHALSPAAIKATRTYIYYSLGGASFGFLGLIYIIVNGSTTDFIAGGVLGASSGDTGILLLIYVMCFCGFSVKAAMFPFSRWLPDAGVAPTPVTALLHAVAVVKAGAFAVMRITYYIFGTEMLAGTWAQYIVLSLAAFTIVYGCSRGVKAVHVKRRLAWSTVSNLSYILFGAALMTPLGLAAALCHMVFHAVMKICSFFCAGAIICKTERKYVFELDGLGRKMPGTFLVFTVSALALMGVPGLCGFTSKWYLAQAALDNGNPAAIAGVAALLISALLTSIYMMTMIVRAFFPKKGFNPESIQGIKDPGWMIMLPLVLLTITMFVFGIRSDIVVNAINSILPVF